MGTIQFVSAVHEAAAQLKDHFAYVNPHQYVDRNRSITMVTDIEFNAIDSVVILPLQGKK